MSRGNSYWFAFAGLLLGSTIAKAADLAISPLHGLYAPTHLTMQSSAATFTATNRGSVDVTLGTPALEGPYSSEFVITTETCSGTTLTQGASCTADVVFKPATRGTKTAMLAIPAGDGNVLRAFLSNEEDTASEVSRRLPPVLESLNVPAAVTLGTPFTISWSLLGYHEDYVSKVVLFDCSGISDGSCGDSYASNVAESAYLDDPAPVSGEWSYNGAESHKHSFSQSFTLTAEQVPTPDSLVVRFYRKSKEDTDLGNPGLSLLIPGNLGASYYDSAGRRLAIPVNH